MYNDTDALMRDIIGLSLEIDKLRNSKANCERVLTQYRMQGNYSAVDQAQRDFSSFAKTEYDMINQLGNMKNALLNMLGRDGDAVFKYLVNHKQIPSTLMYAINNSGYASGSSYPPNSGWNSNQPYGNNYNSGKRFNNSIQSTLNNSGYNNRFNGQGNYQPYNAKQDDGYISMVSPSQNSNQPQPTFQQQNTSQQSQIKETEGRYLILDPKGINMDNYKARNDKLQFRALKEKNSEAEIITEQDNLLKRLVYTVVTNQPDSANIIMKPKVNVLETGKRNPESNANSVCHVSAIGSDYNDGKADSIIPFIYYNINNLRDAYIKDLEEVSVIKKAKTLIYNICNSDDFVDKFPKLLGVDTETTPGDDIMFMVVNRYVEDMKELLKDLSSSKDLIELFRKLAFLDTEPRDFVPVDFIYHLKDLIIKKLNDGFGNIVGVNLSIVDSIDVEQAQEAFTKGKKIISLIMPDVDADRHIEWYKEWVESEVIKGLENYIIGASALTGTVNPVTSTKGESLKGFSILLNVESDLCAYVKTNLFDHLTLADWIDGKADNLIISPYSAPHLYTLLRSTAEKIRGSGIISADFFKFEFDVTLPKLRNRSLIFYVHTSMLTTDKGDPLFIISRI